MRGRVKVNSLVPIARYAGVFATRARFSTTFSRSRSVPRGTAHALRSPSAHHARVRTELDEHTLERDAEHAHDIAEGQTCRGEGADGAAVASALYQVDGGAVARAALAVDVRPARARITPHVPREIPRCNLQRAGRAYALHLESLFAIKARSAKEISTRSCSAGLRRR